LEGVSGEGLASLVGGLCPHVLHKDATIKEDGSFVIFDGDHLFAAGQFLPLEAPNSRFQLHSGRRKLCPHATMLPKPQGHSIIIANSIPQGSILMKKLLNKIGKRGSLFASFQYVQNYWSTLIGSDFKKKHV
jgi:hypothetical protein